MRRFILAVVGVLSVATLVMACPFCSSSGSTLSQEAASAGLILFGTPKNPRLDPKQPGQGLTDLEIEVVVKSHEILAGRKVITLPRYIPQVDPKQPMKYLVFCDVYKGELDFYRGVPFKPDSHIAAYIKGTLEVKDKDLATRLLYFFDYLDDPDPEIANDAYTEFGNADYKDFRPIAARLSAARVIRWLKDPGTPTSRLGLYGSILGHCGKPADAAILKELLDDPKRRFLGGMDGVMAGYTMLAPKDGWASISGALADAKREFLPRYAALRAARFIWDYRPDLVARDEVAAKVADSVNQADIADLVIEDLRKWGYWKAADKVLDQLRLPGHDIPIVRRAVLRYFLRCPAAESPAGSAFVAEQRAKDPKWVEEVESLLAAEAVPIPRAKPDGKSP